jgi:hypothetical protein
MPLWLMKPAIYERNIVNIANWRCFLDAIVVLNIRKTFLGGVWIGREASA